MINLAKLFKDYNDTGALNEHINLYGFVADHVFLTKSGDLGVVIQVEGIDYECLDQNTLDNITRRFEVALRGFRRPVSDLPVSLQAKQRDDSLTSSTTTKSSTRPSRTAQPILPSQV